MNKATSSNVYESAARILTVKINKISETSREVTNTESISLGSLFEQNVSFLSAAAALLCVMDYFPFKASTCGSNNT